VNKLYTLPISVQAVDAFFKKSVSQKEESFEIERINDPFILLFVLYQDYIKLNQVKFRGNLTNLSLQRAFEVVDDLDVLLPKESSEDVKEIQKGLLLLLNDNKEKTLSSDTTNIILSKLRTKGNLWTDSGFAEFFNNAFEYTLEVDQVSYEQMKIDLSKVAFQDPQANYEKVLKVKRETDLEIDTDIYFRPHGNGKNDPAGLLLGFIGANTFKSLESLTVTEQSLLERIFKRRFPKSGLLQETDSENLGKHFKKTSNAINALKSKIDNKVKKHLKQPFFAQDTFGNITFSHTFTCMHSSLRRKHQMQQQF